MSQSKITPRDPLAVLPGLLADLPLARLDGRDDPRAASEMDRQVDEMLLGAPAERFEDGVESSLAASVLALIDAKGEGAVRALGRALAGTAVRPEVAAEVLRWLPQSNDAATLDLRRHAVVEALGHSSPTVRDGAVVALSMLDDPHTTEPLRTALERETVPSLRKDILQVLQQLEGR